MQAQHSDIQQQPQPVAEYQNNPKQHKTLNHHSLYYTFIQRYFTSYQTKTQYLHQHSNGLFVIRVRTDSLPSKPVQIKNLLDIQNVKGKKKRGGTRVNKQTIITHIVCQDGQQIPMYALVSGTVLELNQKLSIDILHRPQGYIAVINPSKNFKPSPEIFEEILLPHQQ